MLRRRVLVIGLSVVLCGLAAGSFDLSWFTIDGGGAMFTSGGPFELSGTIGQPDAGVPMTGGTFELVGGFWAGAGDAPLPCVGDLDGNGTINQSDLGILLAAFGSCPGDGNYNAAAGALAGDACVTQQDLGVLLSVFGTNCP